MFLDQFLGSQLRRYLLGINPLLGTETGPRRYSPFQCGLSPLPMKQVPSDSIKYLSSSRQFPFELHGTHKTFSLNGWKLLLILTYWTERETETSPKLMLDWVKCLLRQSFDMFWVYFPWPTHLGTHGWMISDFVFRVQYKKGLGSTGMLGF